MGNLAGFLINVVQTNVLETIFGQKGIGKIQIVSCGFCITDKPTVVLAKYAVYNVQMVLL